MFIEQVKVKRDAIVALLSAEKLPVDDLPADLDNFLAAMEGGHVIGVIGLEIHGSYGLLRSLAVLPGHRNKGVAGKLVLQLLSLAASNGLKELYLLTETAPEYFAAKGFLTVSRGEVPEQVRMSTQFSQVCPASAIVMKKPIP